MSAPGGRRGKGEAPPQVNMNKVGPLANAPRVSFGTAARFSDPVCANSPGPGRYDYVKPEYHWCKRGPSVSMARRHKSSGTNGGPGPADYQSGSVRPRGPQKGITIGERHAVEDRQPRIPGPGTYDQKVAWDGLRKTMAANCVVPRSGKAYPGPGTYECIDQFHDFTRHCQPKHAIGNALRDYYPESPQPCGPGPAAYDPNGGNFCKRQPVYSMGAQYTEKDEQGGANFVTASQFV